MAMTMTVAMTVDSGQWTVDSGSDSRQCGRQQKIGQKLKRH